jgi:hypothetical protein
MPKNRIWCTGKCNLRHVERIGPLEGGPWVILNPALQ